MKKRYTLLAMFSVLVAVSCLTFYVFQQDSNDSESSLALVTAQEINEKLYQDPVNSKLSDLTIPQSLEGLGNKTKIRADVSQNLVLSDAIRDMFEYYLSTLGEADLEAVISMIQAEINEVLPEPARSEALHLLKRYIDYKIALVEFKGSLNPEVIDFSDPEKLIETQMALREFRANFFSQAENEAFFAEEDAYNAFMIEQLRISHNSELSDEQKRLQLSQAESLLPDSIAQSRKRVQAHAELRKEVAKLREVGGSAEEVYLLREQELGSEAAIALKELDQKRQDWNNRLDVFSNARKRVLNSGLSEADQTESIDVLLAQHFEPSEQKRVRALMGDGRFDSKIN